MTNLCDCAYAKTGLAVVTAYDTFGDEYLTATTVVRMADPYLEKTEWIVYGPQHTVLARYPEDAVVAVRHLPNQLSEFHHVHDLEGRRIR